LVTLTNNYGIFTADWIVMIISEIGRTVYTVRYFVAGRRIYEHQVAVVTKYFTLSPNICWSSVWSLLDVTFLGAESIEVAHRSLEICAPLLL
jgi:hypothetical protein